VRVTLILMKNGLWDFTNTTMTAPMDPQKLVIHEKKDVKARRIILDVVKDHLIPHLSKKKLAREMFLGMKNLFQSSNTNKKMVRKKDLSKVK
jgi:hypothetical protein